jgi:hypothetical protein
MSYSVYVLSNVPYDYKNFLEDNQQFLRNLLSKLGYVSKVAFYFCKETRSYKAFIKIRTTVQDIKIVCWKKRIYDIDNKWKDIEQIILFELCEELKVGDEYIFDIETFSDFINGTHKPWKGNILRISFNELTVEKEDKETGNKKIEYINLDKGKNIKHITFMKEDGRIIPTYLFQEFYYFS